MARANRFLEVGIALMVSGVWLLVWKVDADRNCSLRRSAFDHPTIGILSVIERQIELGEYKEARRKVGLLKSCIESSFLDPSITPERECRTIIDSE